MISFASPAREHAALSEAIESAVLRVLRSGRYVLGEEVQEFESELARYMGTTFAVAVSSGTDALACALHALGAGPGDEAIVPAFGFVSLAEAVVRTGARPVFVDIEPVTLGPDPEALRRAISSRTKAVLVAHLFGQAVEIGPLRRACGAIPIVEDAAQAMGTRLGTKQAGTFTEIGTLSFFPAKPLGAAGDGGAVLVSDARLASRVRQARAHGAELAHQWQMAGGNYRLDAVQAAILRVKLATLPQRTERRRGIGDRLAAVARARGASPLIGTNLCTPGYSSLALRVAHRERVLRRLRESGVDARALYPATLPASRAFAQFGGAGERFVEAERATREILSVPCHAELTDAEVVEIEDALRRALCDG